MDSKKIGLLGSSGITSLSLKEQAYNLIKEGILYHKLKVGTVYSQDLLCTELGISRTPVREALLQLEQEGYVSFLRGKGIVVVPITDARAAEIMEARYYLEQAGCRLAALRRQDKNLKAIDDSLQAMEKHCTSGDNMLLYQLDRSFHLCIFEAAGNSWLLDEIEKLRDHFLRFETFDAFNSIDKAKDVLSEHQAIASAIKEGLPDKAAEAMRTHLKRTSLRTTKHLSPLYENQ